MKIAINTWFINQLTTGSGQYLGHLLDMYLHQCADHTFLLCGPRTSPIAWTDGGLVHCGGTVHRGAVCGEWQTLHTPFDGINNNLAKVWFEQVSFPRACRRWGADLIHVPYWASPLFSSIPVVVTIHDLIPLLLPEYEGGMLGKVYNRLVSASARRAAYVLTDSEASRQDIIRCLHIPAGRVEAIWLAAEERFHPVHDAALLQAVRERYALPLRYLLYLGGFDVRKNVPDILRAFACLEAPDVSLVIAGKLPAQESPFFPSPRRLANELGLEARVRFTGWVDEKDKPAMYSAAEGFIFPSCYEGFGLPPLEAMACGTPVIVSQASSLPELVGEAGLYVEPGNVESLVEAMRHLIEDESLRGCLREAALTQARRFSWAQTAQATLAACAQVAPIGI